MASRGKSYRPKHTLKKRTGPLPLRPKQYAKALYYEFINQFEKVTIKHAHDRRVEKQMQMKLELERNGKSSGHHHLVFGQTSPRARKRQTLSLVKDANPIHLDLTRDNKKNCSDPSEYAHSEMNRRMRHSLHKIESMTREHRIMARRPHTTIGNSRRRRKGKTPRKMKFKEKIDKTKVGLISTRLCASCCQRFRVENLPGSVTKKQIYDLRMLKKEVRHAKAALRNALMNHPNGPTYIFREFGNAPPDESIRQMDTSQERKLHRNVMTYAQFFHGVKTLFGLKFEDNVKQELLVWLDRDLDGDVHLNEFLLLMEEQNESHKKKRRSSISSNSGDDAATNNAKIDLNGSKFVQRDLEHMDKTQHEMQKLPYRLYHTLYEFVPVCRMCSHLFGEVHSLKEEEERAPEEWHNGRPIPVSMRSRHQPRLMRQHVKEIYESWKKRRITAPFETDIEHKSTPLHILSYDFVPTSLARTKNKNKHIHKSNVTPTTSMLKQSSKSLVNSEKSKKEEEVFESEMERKKLSLLYRAWRSTGKKIEDWTDSEEYKIAEEKAHIEAGLDEVCDFEEDVARRSKFIIQGRDDDVDGQGGVIHHTAPALWTLTKG
jgi:hypothetical protein